MSNLIKYHAFILSLFFLLFLFSCAEKFDGGDLSIGWASADITPDQPVLIRGRWVSEGAMDPLTVTALAIESGSGPSSEKVIMVSCDIQHITDGHRWEANMLEDVRERLKKSLPEISSERIILFATHTHVAPYVDARNVRELTGIDLDVMEPPDYKDFISSQIAHAAEQAWKNRQSAGISFGLGHAVAGHNRLATYMTGRSQMYGSLENPEFSHIEGFEDHSVHLLYTWDVKNNLTGVVINITCPGQVQGGYELSSDYWHDLRVELGQRLGDNVHILPQISASGDQSPSVMVEKKAEMRMQELMFSDIESGRRSMGRRKQIATRISDAVTTVLPFMKDIIEWDPVFAHRMERVELTRHLLTMDDVKRSLEGREKGQEQYEELLNELEANPAIKEKPRWYRDYVEAYRRSQSGRAFSERYELEQIQPKMPVEIHVVRIGDVVIVTNPFELYIDYATRIKGRSPAIQTFIVQLAGSASYVPTFRSVAGGGYGSVPANNLIGPEGGQELVENTLELINSLW